MDRTTMSIDRSLVGVLSAMLVALIALSPAPPASAASDSTTAPGAASSRITFGIEPAAGAGSTAASARPYYSFGATRGATLRDRVAVLNYSKKPLHLTVYATDAENTADGGFALLPASKAPTEVGSWINLGARTREVTVAARTDKAPGAVILPISVAIPANATPGDHAGGIVASLETVTKRPSGANIKLEQRVASRVYVRVSGTLAPGLTVANLHAEYKGSIDPVGSGSAVVTYTVRNTGNVKLAARQAVSIGGVFGTVDGAALAQVPLLLPGGSQQVTAVVKGVRPTFVRTATVTLRPLTPTDDVDPGIAPVSTSTHFWAIPWTLLLIVVLLLLVVGWSLRRRNRATVPTGKHGTARTARPVGVPS